MEVLEETINLNIHYLLFQLIHLAVSQDNNVNQEEIIRLISESSFSTGIQRGSKMHLESFAIEYAYGNISMKTLPLKGLAKNIM